MSLSVKPLPHCKSPHSRQGQSRAKTVCTWTKTATLQGKDSVYMDKNSHTAGQRQCVHGQKQPHCKSPHSRQGQSRVKMVCTWTKTATLYITTQQEGSKQGEDGVYMDKNSHTVHHHTAGRVKAGCQRWCVHGQKQPHCTSPTAGQGQSTG